MICLLSVLFAVGGSALISTSFQASLSREEETGRNTCRLLMQALQVKDGAALWLDREGAAAALRQIAPQSGIPAMQLSSDSGELFRDGAAAEDFRDLRASAVGGSLASVCFQGSDGKIYLQVSEGFELADAKLYLNLGYDLTGIYETRAMQQQIFRRIYLLLAALCAVLSYVVSWLVTRPLSQLSRASREIASGNYASRSGIRSGGEVGALSADFDAMAEKVENSIRELQEAGERQEQFMGSFAHEMKTPMTSIIGYADLLRGQSLTPEEQSDAANYIFSEGKRLERLSFRLLDIFVADRRKPVLKPASFAALARDVTEHLRPSMEKEGIALSCGCEEGLCLMEPDLIRTLLLNLLENARRAEPHGGTVRISGGLLPDGYRFSVADDGTGIPKEALQHLTEAFYRVDKARSRAQGNAGLGLTLCAKIAALHGGSIRFQSEPGRGTTVTAELKGGTV